MIKELEPGEACTCGRTMQVLVNGVGQIGVVCWGHSEPSERHHDGRMKPLTARLTKAPILRGLICPSWCTLPKNHSGGCRASKAVIAAVALTSDTPSTMARPTPPVVAAPKRHTAAPRTCPCGTVLVKRQKKCPTCPRKPEPKGHRTYKLRQCSTCPAMYQPTGPRGTTCPACP